MSGAQAMSGMHARGFAVEELAHTCGLSRQGYYQARGRQQRSREREQQALALVRQMRAEHPRIGTRKIYREHEQAFAALKIGRDALFDLLDRQGLLLRCRPRRVQTTDSRHGFGFWENLLVDKETGERYRARRPNEVFVSDITYLETLEGFRYLALITDAYSRKIVGHDLSASLAVEGSLRALERALGQASEAERQGLIHHSDRGVQYCCHAYVNRLLESGARPSMAQAGNPYENAMAERVNGILKQEYGLDALFQSEHEARRAVEQAVELYNGKRPHLALGYRKPSQVHAEYRLAA